jgi:FkbM family methyltransferase
MEISDVFAYVKNHFNDKEKVVFEIGAHRGESSYNIIESLSPIKSYHAFEPDYRNIEQLKKQLKKYSFSKCNFFAIGSYDGETNFYHSGGVNSLSNDWSASSSIKSPKLAIEENPWLNFDRVSKVDIMTLDTYCKINLISEIDFIWADVQGAEEDLILGGVDILRNTKFLFTEYCDFERYENEIDKNKILELLSGWKLIYDFGTDIFLVNESK